MLKIAIDAGHGINTAGKRCMKAIDPNETREWVLNSRIAKLLCEELEHYDCEVLRVDDVTGRLDIPLAERVNNANKWGADVYISIHHNAGLNGKSGGGVMVFYYSSKEERKRQANNLYEKLVKFTGLKGNRSTPVQMYPFYVIKNTTMPAFLFENGFMDSVDDVPVILSDSHATKTVLAVMEFLNGNFNLQAKNVSRETYYERLGKAVEKCLNDIETLDSYKDVMTILSEGE